ncbi:Nitrate/sulfonate/bicarbonate ABC transporter, permease protein [Neorhizobium galegae bv. officinalis bv. officinalis str. HAMBI 1141]|uniref:Nitrate/sulfonate/bicarbonate ABC transporter, permease protein n=1 Tax=Neorhizobium galegae bv. officinalis bv. officinalis str. HAMBI 1141 TaxID=1028801 RepID=A0A068TBC3_NEOGA|nr:Nitrate/sulfonate/bicarbonate ABC transporter, permease protein [Neorhizobium galegae bv. officinalis bv. officinalis str. HAMBI 1141]
MSHVVSSTTKTGAPPERKIALLDATAGVLVKHMPAISAAVGLVVLWQLVVWFFKIPTFMAPSPVDVAYAFQDNAKLLWTNMLPTILEAFLGFVFGNLVAILLAVWFVHSATAEKAFYPIAVFIKAIPIIALAPILVLIFGNGLAPKIIIAGLICFFPTLVNMVQGLKSASPAMLDLMRVLSASNTEILWKVRLPSSMPFLFAALKIAATSSVMGAIVAEWIGSSFGLGALIIEATYNFRSPLLYATVVIAAVLAVVLFFVVSVIEARMIRWKPAGSH